MSVDISFVAPIDVLQQRKNVPSMIIDTRPYAQYVAGHIPGAIWMGWEVWCENAPVHAGQILTQQGYWGVLKEDREAVGESLGRLGLSNDCPVLVYADGPRSKGREGRIAWMLLYWGICSIALLDGGWSGWLSYGGSSDKEIPICRQRQFHICEQPERRVRLDQLRQELQHNRLAGLIDVRSHAEYAGQQYAYQPRQGRLPGAVHLPFTALFDEPGNFVTKSRYLEQLVPRIGKADRYIACCEVGVRSCLFALLHEAYTGQLVANFDGSVMEWALDATLPMESGC